MVSSLADGGLTLSNSIWHGGEDWELLALAPAAAAAARLDDDSGSEELSRLLLVVPSPSRRISPRLMAVNELNWLRLPGQIISSRLNLCKS
jgi:hypothetical protein